MKAITTLVSLLSCLLLTSAGSLCGEDVAKPVEPTLPLGGAFSPDPQEPVFVTVSAGGCRVLVSRDDGVTWETTFVAEPGTHKYDHGTWAAHGLVYNEGVIGVFCGWGGNDGGRFIGSDDGANWAHLSKSTRKAPTMYGPAGGMRAYVIGGMTINTSQDLGATWKRYRGEKRTHHIKAAFGDYNGGRFVVIGDRGVVLYSKDLGRSPRVHLRRMR